MKKIEKLKIRQESVKRQIQESLDLLVGTVYRSPAMMNYSLTTKINGKTVTKYVRKGLVPKAMEMTTRHKEVRKLIQKLSKINWELLLLESKQ